MPFQSILDIGETNAIVGVQGTGKSNLACQMMQCILDRKPFFGYPPSPLSEDRPLLAYCAYDRSEQKCKKLLTKYGLADRIPWKSFRDIPDPEAKVELYPLESLPQTHFKNVQIIVVDGAGLLSPKGKGNDYTHMGSYFRYAGYVANKYGVTFIFILHGGKAREDSQIINSRQLAIGSCIQGGMIEGMIIVEHLDGANLEDPRRTIKLIPHDEPVPRKLLVQFSKTHGFEELNLEDAFQVKNCWFRALPDMFVTSTAKEIGLRYDISDRSVERYLGELTEAHILLRMAAIKGLYKKQLPDADIA